MNNIQNYIPLSIPSIQGNEWKYIKECLDTGWVSSVGEYVNKFEQKICEYTGSKYSIACINGTAALHISLLISGVSSGDEVIIPTLTFIAPVNTIRYCNAYPIFMDSDDYYNIDPMKTIEFIKNHTYFKNGFSYNKKTKKKISALIPIHIFGNAVWLDDLYFLCKERNIRIIEDATESLGTFYSQGKFKGKHTGTIGDFGCISFNGNKIITSGGGGIILTNNKEYAKKAKYLTTQANNDPINYIHNEIGYNYRLTNIQAAMGVAQLEKLPEFIEIKKKNYNLYKEKINKIDNLHLAETPPYANNNYWMYALKINDKDYSRNKNELINHLEKNRIQSRSVWYLNHMQKPFNNYQSYNIDKALELFNKTINIPCSVNLKKEHINKVIKVLKNG